VAKCQKLKMVGYTIGAGPLEQQQFGTAGIERVNCLERLISEMA